MKRNIIGIFAIVIALSASAFTSSHKVAVKRTTNLKWFDISGSLAPTAAVPPANAAYISGADGPTAPDRGCSGSAKQCVSGFSDMQVTPSNTLNGTQTPVDHSSLKQ